MCQKPFLARLCADANLLERERRTWDHLSDFSVCVRCMGYSEHWFVCLSGLGFESVNLCACECEKEERFGRSWERRRGWKEGKVRVSMVWVYIG